MKLFVSYARIDKPFCIQLVDKLNIHDIWYDQRLYAGQDWWQEILRRLEWAEGFMYLLSPDSIASKYCRRELEIAHKLGLAIFPVLIHQDTRLPGKLSSVQYVDMSYGLTVDNVTLLLNSIHQIERALNNIVVNYKPQSEEPIEADSPVTPNVEIIGKAAKALESALYDEAVLLLRQAKANGFKSRFIDIDALLKEAEIALNQQSRRREAEREYKQIAELYRFAKTRDIAIRAFDAFSQEFTEYDPDGLKGQIKQHKLETQEADQILSSKSHDIKSCLQKLQKKTILPMLYWKEIAEGNVILENLGHMTPGDAATVVWVDTFLMSQFPVTNAQFDVFVNESDGYNNEEWWKFSQHALDWYQNHLHPLQSRFSGDERPRENVNWYEAMAFCHWLSHRSGVEITLPTLEMWQRAALGDTDHNYPWGKNYRHNSCNTRESGLKMTTNVDRFPEGASPFGVYDMAGNVWEWCMDEDAPDKPDNDYKRAVIGGSFVSPFDRAQTSFRYFLNPEARYSSIGMRLVVPLPINHSWTGTN